MEIDPENLEGFFWFVLAHLDEKQRRPVSGAMACLLGRGGTTLVAGASGLSRNTVIDGTKAFDAGKNRTNVCDVKVAVGRVWRTPTRPC